MTGLGRTGDGDGGARLWPSDQQSESCRTQCWPFATPYRASSGTHPGGAQPPRHCHPQRHQASDIPHYGPPMQISQASPLPYKISPSAYTHTNPGTRAKGTPRGQDRHAQEPARIHPNKPSNPTHDQHTMPRSQHTSRPTKPACDQPYRHTVPPNPARPPVSPTLQPREPSS